MAGDPWNHDCELPRTGGRCSADWTAASSRCPAAYPTSCSPQAWAAATPLLFLRLLLRLDPWLARDRLHLASALPSWLHRLAVTGIPLGDAQVDVAVSNGEVTTEDLGSHLVSPVPRQPISDLIAAGS